MPRSFQPGNQACPRARLPDCLTTGHGGVSWGGDGKKTEGDDDDDDDTVVGGVLILSGHITSGEGREMEMEGEGDSHLLQYNRKVPALHGFVPRLFFCVGMCECIIRSSLFRGK